MFCLSIVWEQGNKIYNIVRSRQEINKFGLEGLNSLDHGWWWIFSARRVVAEQLEVGAEQIVVHQLKNLCDLVKDGSHTVISKYIAEWSSQHKCLREGVHCPDPPPLRQCQFKNFSYGHFPLEPEVRPGPAISPGNHPSQRGKCSSETWGSWWLTLEPWLLLVLLMDYIN